MSRLKHFGPNSNDQIRELFRAYLNQSTPDRKKEALDRLIDSIYRMEVRYISKLVARKSESELDIDDLANHVTCEFWDSYLIGKRRKIDAEAKVVPLLKKMARSCVNNAVRDGKRTCRHPDGTDIVHSDRIDSVEDKRSGGQPSDRLENAELVDDVESKLGDPILWPVYRMVLDNCTGADISDELKWDLRTAERLMIEVREALRAHCEQNLGLSKEPSDEKGEGRREKGEGRRQKGEGRRRRGPSWGKF